MLVQITRVSIKATMEETENTENPENTKHMQLRIRYDHVKEDTKEF